jgi:Rieske Fe-S protein
MNGGEPGRRKFLKLCAATGALVAARPELLGRQARASTPLPASRLVDTGGRPLDPDSLEVGESYVFHYPFVTTPCFLINLGKPVGPVDGLKTEDGQQYRWPGGAGPRRSVVAFSAICAHKMSYPTKTVSFINYRSDPVKFVDGGRQPAQREHVIYCCSEKSVYDPEDGARVLGGPAPQPLAAVDLRFDQEANCLTAAGTYGGDMFQKFFETYAFQLAMQHRISDVKAPVGDTTMVYPSGEYSENLQVC